MAERRPARYDTQMDFHEISRRRFLEFMGRGASFAMSASMLGSLVACSTGRPRVPLKDAARAGLPFKPIAPNRADELALAPGLDYSILIRWGDVINPQGERFGFNNDYIAFLPDSMTSDEATLWVNHEYPDALFIHGAIRGQDKTRAQIESEQESVGGSLLRIKRAPGGRWNVIPDHKLNRRLTGKTPIPLVSLRSIRDSKVAIGTFGNCAGGVTPWGTVLTCEENTEDYYGSIERDDRGRQKPLPLNHGWHTQFDYPSEHYGWVVEVNPVTGAARKLTALGRFSHECATTVQAVDGRTVTYTGDDAINECLYKFIADRPGSMERGTLYVANLEQGKWLALDTKKNPSLHKHFRDQTDLLIRTREAARLVGGTPLARPEDIERDPASGAILVALTNNKPAGDFHGSILRIMEKGNDPLSLTFESSTFLTGGDSGFACPDNLAFDPAGNLWITTDIAGYDSAKPEYRPFGNNGLFFVPMKGAHAGKAFQVASAPVDAELTGPCFSPDGRTLFLSVQHPGEMSPSLDQLTSHWPDGGKAIPRPSVVMISGPTLDRIMTQSGA